MGKIRLNISFAIVSLASSIIVALSFYIFSLIVYPKMTGDGQYFMTVGMLAGLGLFFGAFLAIMVNLMTEKKQNFKKRVFCVTLVYILILIVFSWIMSVFSLGIKAILPIWLVTIVCNIFAGGFMAPLTILYSIFCPNYSWKFLLFSLISLIPYTLVLVVVYFFIRPKVKEQVK